METLINLYIDLKEIAKLVQKRIKGYYDAKRSKGLDLKEGDKVYIIKPYSRNYGGLVNRLGV